ncbi:hypothetical protein E1B28_009847 [Marasmius oreades]|uniref:Uncharacterized protein n=1 Tax=Marasmius oreades TaxID=181124 RepID=A0A9P7RVW4_9AGAR|nr:uncharacterized protein E1B28_009847 [Marasmius oreades]KAG7090761.1 hypothetical protein E1B28_009847 [Marasmius oreades]
MQQKNPGQGPESQGGALEGSDGRVPSATCGVGGRVSFDHVRDRTSIQHLASEPSFEFTANDEGPRTKSILLGQDSCENTSFEGDTQQHPFPILVACHSNSSAPADDASPLHRGSIRFLPRVRITSGLRNSNGRRSAPASPTHPARLPLAALSDSPFATNQPPSLTSTRSSSISSSISAPIRFREQESVPSKWGPLGRRVSMFASQKRKGRSLKDVKSDWDGYVTPQDVGLINGRETEFNDGNERTPLLGSQEVQVDNGGLGGY